MTKKRKKMQNLNIEGVAEAEKKKIEEAEEPEVADLLGIADDIKFLIDNTHYQNAEIRKGVFFISLEDLESLPKQIAKMVDDKVDNRQ